MREGVFLLGWTQNDQLALANHRSRLPHLHVPTELPDPTYLGGEGLQRRQLKPRTKVNNSSYDLRSSHKHRVQRDNVEGSI